jgi:hypothetical protein
MGNAKILASALQFRQPNGTARRALNVDWLALYERNVKSRLRVEDVYGELSGARVSGGKLRAPCPLHGGKNRSFVVDLATLRWFCHSKCNVGGGPLDFMLRVRGKSGPVRGHAFVELVQALCLRLGVVAEPVSCGDQEASGDAEHVWHSARPVTENAEVARWLAHERGLEAELIATCDLARVVDTVAELPAWAGFERAGRWESWPSIGYRVITPLYDAKGRIQSLRFRKAVTGTKGRSASGIPGAGLVMADGVARHVLVSGQPPSSWSGDSLSLVVAEGEPDFWSWSTESARRGLGDGATHFPGVIGVVSGSFTEAIAARLPRSTHVISAFHHDEGGNRMHERLAQVLARAGRDFSLSRWRAP